MEANKMRVVDATWDHGTKPIERHAQAVFEAAGEVLADMDTAGMTTDQAEDEVRDTLRAQWRRYFAGWDRDEAEFALRGVTFTIHEV